MPPSAVRIRPSISLTAPWAGGRRLLERTRGARLPTTIVMVIVLAAALAPLIAPYGPNQLDPLNALAGPTTSHLFGTDDLGRDLFSRLLYGGRLSLLIAFFSTLLAMVSGLVWGASAALSRRRWIDDSAVLTADALLGIPTLLSGLVLIAAFGSGKLALVLILGIINAPASAKVVRAAVLGEKHAQYCVAATALGATRWRLFVSEILPNTRAILVVQSVIVAANIILLESGLSFLGLGVQPPEASWGTLLFQGYTNLYASTWYIFFPGLAIVLTIWALNAIGDRFEYLLDPRVRHIVRAEP